MKNKSLFSRLLENKKMMLLVSFLLSFVFWIVSSDNVTITIDNVPVRPILSESAKNDGLKIYSVSPETVSVNITGKRVIINALTSSDFTANVDMFNVIKPGTDTYEVDIESDSSKNFSIDDSKPIRVTVTVDKEIETVVPLNCILSYDPEGYHVDNNIPSNITIKGPESVVSKVKSAYVMDKITMDGSEAVTNKTLTVHLSTNSNPTSSDLGEFTSAYLDFNGSIDAEFVFMNQIEDIPFDVKFSDLDINLPDNYFSIDPPVIDIASKGEIDIKNISINLGETTDYDGKNVVKEIPLSSILGEDMICLDKNLKTVTVSINFEDYLTIEKFEVDGSYIKAKNLSDEYIPSSAKVILVGKESALDAIRAGDISVECDFKDITISLDHPVSVPVKVNIESSSICWAYIPNGTLSVQLSKK